MDTAWCMATIFIFFSVFLMDIFDILNIFCSCVMEGTCLVAIVLVVTTTNETTFYLNLRMLFISGK